jgi:ATP-dependent Clp protease ATP-binding subunit ClpA
MPEGFEYEDEYEDSDGNEGCDSGTLIASLTARAKEMQRALLDKVVGQYHAVSTVVSGYFRSSLTALTDEDRKVPATFLFAGAPGVGKTFLAQTFADHLGLPFERFDMSEYADQDGAMEFCGSDRVYTGSKSGNFTSFVSKNPRCVVLFDEIEKAHISVIHLFLQMLDAGRIRDSHTDCEISLKDTVLIFTTNAGRQLYEGRECTDLSLVPRRVILRALEKDVDPSTGNPYFPAAICSRFATGNVVLFNKMSAESIFFDEKVPF